MVKDIVWNWSSRETSWSALSIPVGMEMLTLRSPLAKVQSWWRVLVFLLLLYVGYVLLTMDGLHWAFAGGIPLVEYGVAVWLFRESESESTTEEEALAAKVLGVQRSVTIDGKPAKAINGKGELGKMAREWRARVQCQFGKVQNKEADLIAVRKWLNDAISSDPECVNLRTKHKLELIMTVSALATVPTLEEVDGMRLADTVVARIMRQQVKATFG